MKNIPTINIDMDKKCEKCGAGGACQNGLCMKCNARRLTEQNMPIVGERTLAEIVKQVSGLFELYEPAIDRAIKKNGNQLDVSFTAKLQSYANNQVVIQTGISFTAEKIKDFSEKSMISESQKNLDFEA